jgi:predicted outer membrane repeat protein
LPISGGAIDNYGTLTISDSIFTRNTHAISNFGALAIEDTAFVDNVVNGIYNRRSVTITRSLFTGNGHGIDNDYGKVIAVNSTFANNRFTLPNGVGAGIANSGTVTLINSTFTGNEAPAGGGAIATHLGGTVTLINTIIANSVPAKNCFGPMIDGGHNLQYPGTSCGESIPTTDPKLLTLADNGGITLSVGLSTDSPAVGAGDPEQCTTSAVNNEDQRGMIRIAAGDTSCDIGAFELQAPLITAPNRFAIVSFQPR